MQLQAAIDSQGRILVPSQVRRQLGLGPGQPVRIDVDGDRLIVMAAEAADRCGTCGQIVTASHDSH